MTGSRVQAIFKAHHKQQKPLVRFACRQLTDMREDAAGVGLYVFQVVVRAFLAAKPALRRVRHPEIECVLAIPETELDAKARSVEPHATAYVDGALTEDDDDVVLAEVEEEHCRFVLDVVIVCLHEAANK